MWQKWLRILLIIAGTVSMGLGIVGIFVPVLPTTPFLLLAAVCYARSSRLLYDWLLHNRYFGDYIRDYRQKKAVSLRVKAFILVLLWITIGVSVIFAVESLVVRVILVLIAIGVSFHVVHLRTLRR